MHADILNEDLWTMGFGWDKPIACDMYFQGKLWFLELKDLKEIKVPWSLKIQRKKIKFHSHLSL